MESKEKLKMLFFGKLRPFPHEIADEMTNFTPPVPVSHEGIHTKYKVLFAVGHVK
jgi:hypothetical protein